MHLSYARPHLLRLKMVINDLRSAGQTIYLNNTNFSGRDGTLIHFSFSNQTWNSWSMHKYGIVDFSNAHVSMSLHLACLAGTNFRNATLDNASFRGSWMRGSDFTGASCRNTCFGPLASYRDDFCNMVLSDTPQTILRYAKFIDCDLHNADFERADLSNADFTGAKNVDSANFDGALLDDVISLPCSPTKQIGPPSDQEKWNMVYVAVRNTSPSPAQRAAFSLELRNYDLDDLVKCRFGLAAIQRHFTTFIAMSERPGGNNCSKNIYLIQCGIKADEFDTYNQFRSQHLSSKDAVKQTIKARLQ